MATQCFYCYQCHKRYPTHQTLFDTLYEFSKTSPENCPACGGARELRVSVDFQLGGGDGESRSSRHSFLTSWNRGWEKRNKR